ncbi:hypothetical protein OG735_20990 [Streptomyces sp. NBC_01210]|nr:hypothetical protein OG735_20990 [Streptomyces sp. NBC_01210]
MSDARGAAGPQKTTMAMVAAMTAKAAIAAPLRPAGGNANVKEEA